MFSALLLGIVFPVDLTFNLMDESLRMSLIKPKRHTGSQIFPLNAFLYSLQLLR